MKPGRTLSKSTTTLAELRRRCRLTREEAGILAGLTPATIQAVELGRSTLTRKAAKRLSHATGCNVRCLTHDIPLVGNWEVGPVVDLEAWRVYRIKEQCMELEDELRWLTASIGGAR